MGAFNIVGAVLENDLHMFRFLWPHEVTWKNEDVQQKAVEYFVECQTNNTTIGSNTKPSTSVHELPEFMKELAIDWQIRYGITEFILSIHYN